MSTLRLKLFVPAPVKAVDQKMNIDNATTKPVDQEIEMNVTTDLVDQNIQMDVTPKPVCPQIIEMDITPTPDEEN
jgi:hypothetical protein